MLDRHRIKKKIETYISALARVISGITNTIRTEKDLDLLTKLNTILAGNLTVQDKLHLTTNTLFALVLIKKLTELNCINLTAGLTDIYETQETEKNFKAINIACFNYLTEEKSKRAIINSINPDKFLSATIRLYHFQNITPFEIKNLIDEAKNMVSAAKEEEFKLSEKAKEFKNYKKDLFAILTKYPKDNATKNLVSKFEKIDSDKSLKPENKLKEFQKSLNVETNKMHKNLKGMLDKLKQKYSSLYAEPKPDDNVLLLISKQKRS